MSTIFPGSASVGQVFDGYSFDGTAWNIIGIDLTADYQPRVENISDTEIGYLNNASANIQTQLNAKANLSGATFTGNITAPEVSASTKLVANSVGGDEGGEILLGKPATNSTIAGTGVTVDVFQNRLRIFEQGGDARGFYLDLTKASNGVGTNIAPGDTGVPFRMAAGRTGSISMSTNNGNGWYYGSVAITFPAGRFSVAPIVTTGSDYSFIPEMCNPMSVTSSGFNMFAVSATAGRSIATHWTAVQMTSGAASG
jgi:hypothetical protein